MNYTKIKNEIEQEIKQEQEQLKEQESINAYNNMMSELKIEVTR